VDERRISHINFELCNNLSGGKEHIDHMHVEISRLTDTMMQGSPQEKFKVQRVGMVCDHINHFCYYIKEI
jgi:hypothetical protein